MTKMEAKDYRSYLLRMWHIQDNDTSHWRISLECVNTGERLGFEGLEALMTYLSEMEEPPEGYEGQNHSQPHG